jgi:hypothetical protein
MQYPTLDQVEQASQMELGKWLRFLPSPGMSAIDKGITGDELEEVRSAEDIVLARIAARFDGWTAKLSKAIGW